MHDTYRRKAHHLTATELTYLDAGERVELDLPQGQRLHLKRTRSTDSSNGGAVRHFIVLSGQTLDAETVVFLAATTKA